MEVEVKKKIKEFEERSKYLKISIVSGKPEEPRLTLIKPLREAGIEYGDSVIIYIEREGKIVIEKL